MAEIRVREATPETYHVELRDGENLAAFEVAVPPSQLDEYGGGASGEALVEESFRFLLEREPKEMIMKRFELSTIARFFPEYPEEIRRRLSR